jgi:hypothetical protein
MLAKRTVRFASGGAAGDSCRPGRGRDFQKDAGLVILFALTIFLGAFLLFQVQPMMAKFILPWFGGGPGVWTVCLLFFQACLLGGYAYAHALSRFFSRRTQVMTHVVLLVAALFFLPIVPGAHWEPQTEGNPTGRILLLLTVCLGLPYFVLSSTGPLLQVWFSQCRPGVTPYRLYALSNAGSLLALISYPFVFEPALTRRAQAGIWAWSFGAFVLLCGGCAWLLWRAAPAGKKSDASVQETGDCPPTAAVKGCWFALPACGSVLLLATTNKLCLDVPSIPFLWVFVGVAIEPVSAHLHHLFRPAGLVCAEDFFTVARPIAGVVLLRVVPRLCGLAVVANSHLRQHLVRGLHGVPRGSVSPETRAAISDVVLFVRGGGRRGGRSVRGDYIAADL